MKKDMRQQPRPDDDQRAKGYVPEIGQSVYFINGGPRMTVTALIKDHLNLPWAAECGWFLTDRSYFHHTFDLDFLTNDKDMQTD